MASQQLIACDLHLRTLCKYIVKHNFKVEMKLLLWIPMLLGQDVHIDLKKSNQETLVEAGSLLLIRENLPSPEVPSLYTRVCRLQRLKVRSVFYKYSINLHLNFSFYSLSSIKTLSALHCLHSRSSHSSSVFITPIPTWMRWYKRGSQ